MKKIVFATIPMQKITPQHYASIENEALEYEGETCFPVNALLAKTLKKDDEVTVVRIVTEGKFSEGMKNIQREELDKINASIGANIVYAEINAPFKETSDVVESRFRQILGNLKDDCVIYPDMTYGPKTLTPVLFFALGFAEKFFNAEIANIVYGKVLHDNEKKVIGSSAVLYDVTPLYYLNSLTSVMSAPDSKTALERLDKFFAM